MIHKSISIILLLFAVSTCSFAQDLDKLNTRIKSILAKYNAKVGIAIHNDDFSESLVINGDHHYPMQSTYKFHLAIAVLDQVDKGNLSIDQPIEISKEKVTTDLYSPIKDTYPNGTTLSLKDVIEYTVAESDNVGCDILFELLGGPEKVQKYFVEKGYSNISIKLTETVQQAEWDLQYQNWITVSTSNKIIHDYYKNDKNSLSESSYQFLWDTMRSTNTGQERIKKLLPNGTVVAHKTGTSGINKKTKETAATNDLGVVSLPSGKVFYITVLVTDSKESYENNEKIIAEVAMETYDSFMN